MTTRTLTVLAIAAAALVLLAVFAERSGGPSAGGAPELLLPGLTERLNDVERVTLVRAGNETVATLEPGESGWTVAERDGYPADTPKLRQALIALGEARLVERKTANETLHERIGVEDVSRSEASGLALTIEGGGDWPTLILGDAEGTGYRYVRRADEAQSWLIDRNPDLPRSTSQWLDPSILDVRGDRVQQVTITHPDGEIVRVYKDERGAANFSVADVPEGRELQYPGVANVTANALRELRLEDVERASAAPEEPVTTVEYRTFDGLVVRGEGFERGDQAWIAFTASFDPDQAQRFAESAQSGDDADGGAESAADDGADASAIEDEAAAINARTAGWRYRIASYQFDQMTRRLEDFLQALPADDEE